MYVTKTVNRLTGFIQLLQLVFQVSQIRNQAMDMLIRNRIILDCLEFSADLAKQGST